MGEVVVLGVIAGGFFYGAIALPDWLWTLRMALGYTSLILFGLTLFSVFFPEIAGLTLDTMKGVIGIFWKIGEEL